MRTHRSHLWLAFMAMLMAVLACTSNDTLFIKLTEAPTPTITPTPLPQDTQTRYQPDQTVYLIGTKRQIDLGDQPGARNLSTSGNFASCFRNAQVKIISASKSMTNPDDPIYYYNINCTSNHGWVPEYSLTVFKPNGGTAVVKSPDGKGAPLYQRAEDGAATVQDAPCPDGTKVTISDITRKLNVAATSEDPTLFAKVTCGDASGYVLESMLTPATP
jgi:hypothetical protein